MRSLPLPRLSKVMRSGASGALADVADAQSDDSIGLVLLDGVTHPAGGPLKG